MININSTFTRNYTDRKQPNKDRLEISKAKSVAIADLKEEIKSTNKLSQLNSDITDFSYNKIDEDITTLEELLDEPIAEIKEDDDSITRFDNFFRDYELDNGDRSSLKHEMGEFYEETQYDENDVPLAESVKPYRHLSIELFSPYRYSQDTDMDFDSKHALNRINYSERIHSKLRLKDDSSNVGIISELASTLAEKEGKNYADRCVDLSVLKQANGVRSLSPNLFRFVAKYPGHRKHVVQVDKRGNESYNASYGHAYERMLDETKDVETIKRVLRSGTMFVDKNRERQDPILTNFAVDVYKKTHNWNFDEKMLVDSVKNKIRDPKTELIKEESIDNSRLNKAKELLKSDASIEECLYKMQEF